MDWQDIVAKEMQAFASSTAVCAFWWGAEAQTKVKDLEKKQEQTGHRVRNSNDLEEVKSLRSMSKQLGIIKTVLETANVHGAESVEFRSVLDLQYKQANLEPTVIVERPHSS